MTQIFKNNQFTTKSVAEKFVDYTDKTKSSCWLWIAGKTSDGYGTINFQNKTMLAHRVSWQFYKGEIPSKMLVCHKCDEPSCVNPEHLFLGTQADNMNDMKSKNRRKNIGCAEKNGRAKLTMEKAFLIREKRNQKIPLAIIAKEFNVGQSTISRVCRMENWI
jgi:hypothetical protein